MSEHSKYQFPDFIAQELGKEGVLSDGDLQIIHDIYQKAENFTYPATQTEANWLKVKERLNLPVMNEELKVVKKPLVYSFMRWAVAAVLVLAVAFGVYRFSKESNRYMPMAQSTDGVMKKVSLPDGSVVTLNTFSNISTNDFDADERIVDLTGEAYFEVLHSNKPFIVHTSKGNIKVLGTKFNVRNRKDRPLQVALSSGSVVLSTSTGLYKIKPGEVLTEGTGNTLTKTLISPSTLGWLEDKLVFENETLANIVSALESQYNFTLIYDSNLKSEKLTVTFHKLTAQQAVDLLSKTLNSKVIVK